MADDQKNTDLIRCLLFVCSAVTFYLAIHFPVLLDYIHYGFDDGTYSHAYLVPFVVIYLLYDGAKSNQFIFRFSIGAALATVFVGLLLTAAFHAQIAPLFRALLPVGLTLFLLTLFRPTRAVLMPGLMLLFIAPIWGVLTVPLQTLSTTMVSILMKITPVVFYVEGNSVQIPSGVFEIAGGCSGLRYILVSLMLAVLYSHLFLRKTKNIVFVFVLATAGALIVNWIRIAALITIGFYTEMQSPLMDDHNTFGWYLFVPFMIIFFVVTSRLKEDVESQKTSRPLSVKSGSIGLNPKAQLISFVLVIAALSPILGYSAATNEPTAEQLPQLTQDKFAPNIADHSATTSISQEINGLMFDGFLVAFAGERDSNKATYYLNDLIPADATILDARRNSQWNIRLVEKAGTSGSERHLILFAYGTSSGHSPSQFKHKLSRLLHGLLWRQDSSVIWLTHECASDLECNAAIESVSH